MKHWYAYVVNRLAHKMINHSLRFNNEGWQGSYGIRIEHADFDLVNIADDARSFKFRPGDYCELVFK